jgi:hypothetical protein
VKTAPTLIDELYRASFRNTRVPGWTSNALWRDALRKARRFVLDDAMSAFLGDLATQAFVRPQDGVMSDARAATRHRMVEHLRMSARLPSEVTWIEYNLPKCQARCHALIGNDEPDYAGMPEREGWLLQRHPHLDTAFIAHIISSDPLHPDTRGETIWTFPIALAWTADMDTVLPWRTIPFNPKGLASSEVATGLNGYKSERMSYVFSPMVVAPSGKSEALSDLLSQWTGVQRRMWALLATINDLPVEMTEVRASKGFIGRHQYRRFLDHKTVTLTVPVRLYRKTVRAALAVVHRRGGPVREHWRRDWRKPLSVLCEHDWGADENHMFCTLCKGRKIWVHEHVRGDTSRGFVSHDYRVTHEE